jgi:hypothetical protein
MTRPDLPSESAATVTRPSNISHNERSPRPGIYPAHGTPPQRRTAGPSSVRRDTPLVNNALAETIIGLYKTELIRRRGPVEGP